MNPGIGQASIPRSERPIDPEIAEAIAGLKGKEQENTCGVLGTLLLLECYERQGFGIPDCRFFDGVIPAYREMIAPVLEGSKDIDACAGALPRIAGAISCAPSPPIEFGCDFSGARQLAFDEKKRIIPLLNRTLARPIGVMDRVVAVKSIGVGTREGTILRYHSHCYCRDGRWRLASGHVEAWAAFVMAVRAQALAREAWSVRLRLSDATPSVCLFTNPTGVLGFFRLREIPPGKSRREALVHWVQEHWRKSSVDPDAVVCVREHLRGRKTFRWHGMEVEIHIPDVATVARVDA